MALQAGLYWAIYGKGTMVGHNPLEKDLEKDRGLVRSQPDCRSQSWSKEGWIAKL